MVPASWVVTTAPDAPVAVTVARTVGGATSLPPANGPESRVRTLRVLGSQVMDTLPGMAWVWPPGVM